MAHTTCTCCRLYDLLDYSDCDAVRKEIRRIAQSFSPAIDIDLLDRIHSDVIRIFHGQYPGFQASSTKYHDLEHTNAVTLATARILHGVALLGEHPISASQTLTALIAALFHDLGLIQTHEETDGTGARFMAGHEKRSITFLQAYCADSPLPAHLVEDATQIIQATELASHINDIPFRNSDVRFLACVVGSADLLAQMADRNYLDKLFFLFEEFEEAGLNNYTSEFDLLQQTSDFYNNIVLPRLDSFGNVAKHTRLHFFCFFQIDEDLYAEATLCNIKNLQHILAYCQHSRSCYTELIKHNNSKDSPS